MQILNAVMVVKAWASQKDIVKSVIVFGSRVRGTHHWCSDIDIAVALIFFDANTCLAHWMAHEEEWRAEIQSLLPWKVDLQLLHPAIHGMVESGVNESSLVAFDRSA